MGLGPFLTFVAGAVAAGTLYCQTWCVVAFPPVHRMPMPFEASLAWAVSAIAPWVAGFEVAKRRGQFAQTVPGRLAVVAAAFAGAASLSVILELGLDRLIGVEATRPLSLQLAAQIPLALLTAGLLLVGSTLRAGAGQEQLRQGSIAQLLADCAEIEWIKAAGNYVEVSRAGRASLHRATMDGVERSLDPARFARINRSLIVNRGTIDAEVRIDGAPGVRLSDGSLHKVGERYVLNLRQRAG